jgi:nuclease HARBI1
MDTSSSDDETVIVRKKPLYKPRINFDIDNFKECFRLSRTMVDTVVNIIGGYLEPKTYQNFALTPIEQILLSLRFLATGGYYALVGDAHGLHKSTVSRKIRAVVQLIVKHIWSNIVKFPSSAVHLVENAAKFHDIAGITSVIGCMDGTHVRIKMPSVNEGVFVNRHQEHSINCLMVCGPDFKFYYVSAKWPGSVHDARVLRNSTLFKKFDDGWRPFPRAIILADSGYSCTDWCIPPFDPRPRRPLNDAENKFNKAHKKTRRIIENAFGILKQRFRCLLDMELRVSPKFAGEIILACTALHNITVSSEDDIDIPVLAEENDTDDEEIYQDLNPNLRMQQLINLFQ